MWHHDKFRADQSNRCRDMDKIGHFSIFQDGGRLPSWICCTPQLLFGPPMKCILEVSVTVQKLV